MTKRARDQLGSSNECLHLDSRHPGRLERKYMHARSRHNDRDDFVALSRAFPVLRKHMLPNTKWKPHMPKYLMYHYDFAHPDSVYHLSKAILKITYGLNFYLPCGCLNGSCDPLLQEECSEESDSHSEQGIELDVNRYLSPCVPSRANYLHHAADLLHPANNTEQSLAQDIDAVKHDMLGTRGGSIPRGENIKVLDVGTGANCIYPLLGVTEYGWRFIASDVDPAALTIAKHNLKANNLSSLVEIRHQSDPLRMFRGVLRPDEFVHLTMCNPPFHSSLDQTNLNPRTTTCGTVSELMFPHENVGTFSIDANNKGERKRGEFAVTGQVNYTFSSNPEEHGELAFLEIMLVESRFYVHNVLWFTSLVAKLSTLKRIKGYIQVEMRRYNASSAKQVAYLDARIDRLLGKATEEVDENLQIPVSSLHACEFRTFTLNQGRQTRWAIAWTYYNAAQRHRALKKAYN